MKSKICKECISYINSKPLPTCQSSKTIDLVDGKDKRPCIIERLDGIGRCGTMANNYTGK